MRDNMIDFVSGTFTGRIDVSLSIPTKYACTERARNFLFWTVSDLNLNANPDCPNTGTFEKWICVCDFHKRMGNSQIQFGFGFWRMEVDFEANFLDAWLRPIEVRVLGVQTEGLWFFPVTLE